jgi:hypothetical protein
MTKFSKLWAIHCEENACPVFVGWAPSEVEAKARLKVLRKQAGKAAVRMEFWVARMTPAEVEDFKDVGAIPPDA